MGIIKRVKHLDRYRFEVSGNTVKVTYMKDYVGHATIQDNGTLSRSIMLSEMLSLETPEGRRKIENKIKRIYKNH